MWTELSFSFLVALATVSLGAAALLVGRLRRESRVARARVLQDDGRTAVLVDDPAGQPSELQRGVRRLGEMISRQEVSNQLRKSLASAGIYAPSAPATYLGYKVVFFVLGFAVIWRCQ